ncbi:MULTISPECIES: carbohydrate ABC transporter permease [Streptosporangium]|uniref:Multiple sugar transport system permease protein n=1 Tax=Streptosporangium brasiliense TaxID=47480 RepID=A0ABT9RKH8_9ACTN|nr:carbohydrate ABC transporter permease [Streptosporangium brasiliense]MDP9869806.1 multiple sugar transport system permease protein [Streptosporangium brasiliense]
MRATIRSQVLTTAVLCVVAAYVLLPLWWLVVSATKSGADLFDTPALWFGSVDIGGNLDRLMSQDNGLYPRWLLNTLVYAGGGALGATLLAAMAGYGLAKYPFRGRGAVFAVIMGAVLIPTPLLTLPLYLLLSKVGLLNSMWGMLLPCMVSPFGVFLARAYAQAAVPDDLLEAGRIDGAGELRIFFTVAVRLMAPALVTLFLFQAVAIWNNFFLPMMVLNDQSLWPITLGLAKWNGIRTGFLRDAVVMGSLISVIPVILAFVALQRFWKADLAAGSVKL